MVSFPTKMRMENKGGCGLGTLFLIPFSLFLLLSFSGPVDAYKNYTVGDSLGWYDTLENPKVDYQKWVADKNFTLGDFLSKCPISSYHSLPLCFQFVFFCLFFKQTQTSVNFAISICPLLLTYLGFRSFFELIWCFFSLSSKILKLRSDFDRSLREFWFVVLLIVPVCRFIWLVKVLFISWISIPISHFPGDLFNPVFSFT